MKTAISIPDQVFQAAETLANRMGVSRSELYSKAIEDFVRNNKNQGVTNLLDQVYSSESSSLGSVHRKLQLRSLDSEDWS